MKKIFILFLALAFCAPVWGQNATVVCNGAESGGTDPLDYAYELTAGAVEATHLFVGTCDGNPANYTNIRMPANWDFQIVTDEVYDHFDSKTPHGQISPGPNGTCPYYISFTVNGGAPIGAGNTFAFGFDNPHPSHDVAWDVDGTPTNWGAPVGEGEGPIHAPDPPLKERVPSMTNYGLIALLALIILTTVVVWRRQRVSA